MSQLIHSEKEDSSPCVAHYLSEFTVMCQLLRAVTLEINYYFSLAPRMIDDNLCDKRRKK